MIASSGCTPTMILLTHGHFDHYTAVKGLLEKWPELPVYIHESDVTDKPVGSFGLLFPRLPEKNQRYYKEGDRLTLGGLTITVLETPGHSRGSVCLVVGDVIFSGDTLFHARSSPEAAMRTFSTPLKSWPSFPGSIRSIPATTAPPTWTLSAGSIPM